jgi:predicted enzyme related to lactoylglutathione lyase/uncharacterized protein YndB with AHSA1/START domain
MSKFEGVVRREVRLALRPEDAFSFFTDADKLARWAPSLSSSVDWRQGAPLRARLGPGLEAVGEVLELVPAQRIVMSWGLEGTGNLGVLPGSSRVEILFSSMAGGLATTLVTVIHRGLPPGLAREEHGLTWDHFLARLSVATAGREVEPSSNPPSIVANFEIQSRDPSAAHRFYGTLFDWQIDTSNPLKYGLVNTGSGIKGGIGPGEPGVVLYVRVADVSATLGRAVALGGAVALPPTSFPGGVSLALFTDPEGNRIGLLSM